MTQETLELDNYIESLGLSYNAVFIPQSQSRNKAEKHLSLNWKITIGKRAQNVLTTDYMQGIAHIPNYHKIVGYGMRRTVAIEQFEKIASEQGKYAKSLDSSFMLEKLPAPKLKDVLHSLVMDSDVIDYASFEDWASNFGYDTDSREAERIYKACLDTALKLRNMIGSEAMEKLKVLFQDY